MSRVLLLQIIEELFEAEDFVFVHTHWLDRGNPRDAGEWLRLPDSSYKLNCNIFILFFSV